MPCATCQSPSACTEMCQAFRADLLRQCEASGQMDSAQVNAHVQAGELPAAHYKEMTMNNESPSLQSGELLPCPFCGGDELSHGHSFPPHQGDVQCHTCDALIFAGNEAQAITAWNRRAAPSPVKSDRDAGVAQSETLAEQGCNCRWKDGCVTQRCELHEAWHTAIHEWAERAKTAEGKLAATGAAPSAQEQPVEQEWVAQVVSSGPHNFPLLEWRSANHSLETTIGTKLYASPPPISLGKADTGAPSKQESSND